jgi:hypothetical protein
MTHPSEIAKAREALATAVLLEYKDNSWTKQQILVPSVKVGDEWSRPLLIQRWLASNAPRKQWRIYRGPITPAELDTTSLFDVMGMASNASGYFSVLRHFEEAIKNNNVRAVPLVLADLTEADAIEAFAGKAPSALLRRIQRARLEAGYPEHAFEWPAPAVHATPYITPTV